jgi:hypothetical protein
MNPPEFGQLHGECETARLGYVAETAKTSHLLSKITAAPLGFDQRLALAAQGILENEAHLMYLGMRNQLLEAARLGYGNAG